MGSMLLFWRASLAFLLLLFVGVSAEGVLIRAVKRCSMLGRTAGQQLKADSPLLWGMQSQVRSTRADKMVSQLHIVGVIVTAGMSASSERDVWLQPKCMMQQHVVVQPMLTCFPSGCSLDNILHHTLHQAGAWPCRRPQRSSVSAAFTLGCCSWGCATDCS